MGYATRRDACSFIRFVDLAATALARPWLGSTAVRAAASGGVEHFERLSCTHHPGVGRLEAGSCIDDAPNCKPFAAGWRKLVPGYSQETLLSFAARRSSRCAASAKTSCEAD